MTRQLSPNFGREDVGWLRHGGKMQRGRGSWRRRRGAGPSEVASIRVRSSLVVASGRVCVRAVWAISADRSAMCGRGVRVYAKRPAALDVLLGRIGGIRAIMTIDAVNPPVRLTATPLQSTALLCF